MAKPYSMALKQKLIARLTGPNAVSAAQLARETGITQQNLSRWLSQARALPLGDLANCITSTWTAAQKARIVTQATALSGDDLTRYLEREGVKPALFKRWLVALEEAGEESVGMAKRIGRLERELIRKERALAEAAALLVLRETIQDKLLEKEYEFEERAEEAETGMPS
jgi:transposase